MPAPPDRRPPAPGVMFASIALALAAVVGIAALTAADAPPPTVAEFAPQAIQKIEDAPREQTSEFGSGEGGEAIGKASLPTPAVSPPAIVVPRVRRCVGDPPRQIEDPQSPPCVPYWKGNNGGATWKGVTKDTIRVAVPDNGTEDLPFQKFFNRRFEFYGRKLELIATRDDFGGTLEGGPTPDVQRSAAVAADQVHKVFATTDATFGSGFHYYDEMARRKLMVAAQRAVVPETYLASRHPHIWQYVMATDKMFRELGAWTCTRLAGRNAAHAGAAEFRGPRVFGAALGTATTDVPIHLRPLERAMASCGAKLAKKLEYQTGEAGSQNESNAALQFRTSGVTTVFCLADFGSCASLALAATGQGYSPEWVLSTYGRSDTNFGLKAFQYPSEQLAHTFGLTFQPRQISPGNEPITWATQEADESGRSGSNLNLSVWNLNIKYRSLLLLASGIQMAGPNLTPATFADALHRTKFPNPSHPNMPGKVGFNDGGHSMTTDAAEWWWDNGADSPYSDESTGSICYVDHGERHSGGDWPSEDGLFKGPCDSGA